MYERLNGLFNSEQLKKINKAHILLVGVGGVGSFALEVLVRSGIENITVVDFDTYELSNLNRQLHSTQNVIGKKKVDVLKKAMLDINPKLNIIIKDEYLTSDSIIDFTKYDYIVDACDSIKAKTLLITKAFENNIKIISAMGIGNRSEPSQVYVTTLNKTYNDPLAKKMRNIFKDQAYKNKIKVVSSKELPIKSQTIFSYIGVTSLAGILLGNEVIKDIINEKDN